MLHLNKIASDHQEFCRQEQDKSLLPLTLGCPGFLQPFQKAAVGRVFVVVFVALMKGMWKTLQDSPGRKLFVQAQGHRAGRSGAAPLLRVCELSHSREKRHRGAPAQLLHLLCPRHGALHWEESRCWMSH